MTPPIAAVLEAFEPISLDEIDERAALQRRVDRKYLLTVEQLAELLEELRRDHQVLEIGGRRCFDYESVYFDSPGLASYHDHREGRRPRAKVRSRLYVDTDTSFFEAKLKLEDDETNKAHIEQPPRDHGRISPEARRFLEETLSALDGRIDVDELRAALTTRFERFTLAAADGTERVTCDLSLRLTAPGRGSLVLQDGHTVLETKTETGNGRCDQCLDHAGVESLSFSKYRVGIGLLTAEGEDAGAEPMRACFRRESDQGVDGAGGR
jgi:hypothetical protein